MSKGLVRVLAAVAVAIAVLLNLAGGPSPLAQERIEYTLGSGDRLRVIVFGEEDLSGEFEVDGSGSVSLKLLGRVQVGGMTLPQAERQIVAGLKSGGFLIDPRVAVEVMNFRPFFILGEVEKRGQYPFVNGMTVAQAVAIAGGYTYRAAQNRITIERFGTKGERPAGENMPVLPGDIIRVPERFF